MISTLTGSSDPKIITPYSGKEPYAPFVDVECNEAFSIAYGRIVFVGHDGAHNTITVRINDNEVLRYAHLKNYEFRAGSVVTAGIRLGRADKFVRFEYCTSWQGESKFPVHIGKFCYYKQDPTSILEGSYMPRTIAQMPREFTHVYNADVEYTNDTQKAEFGDNRAQEK